MPGIRFRYQVMALAALCLTAAVARGDERASSVKKGAVELKSAGPMAFGPDGTLFVGDTKGAALYAIDTGESAGSAEKRADRRQGCDRHDCGLGRN